MGKVIFVMNVSLDGYVETADHSLDWTINDDELLAWFNERMRSFEALVYGRRLYELMNAYWPTADSDPTATGPMVEFARIWNAKPKVVVSSSMHEAPAGWRLTSGDPETILEELRREFDGDLEIGGPTLAAIRYEEIVIRVRSL
jgi:dihydrofolate reductase